MSDKIEFVKNFHDLSTDTGFQFEFYCDKCGSGFRTKFKPSLTGRVTGLLNAASSIFGGALGRAADLGERVRGATWQKARDDAYAEAIQELKPDFIQCPRCSSWVCKKSCWNNQRGLCKQCAPDMGVEMSAAQASRSVEEVWAHAKMSEDDKKLAAGNWRETIRASCPQCGASLATNAKFCPECGAKLKEKNFCSQCGASMAPGAKFCPECGTAVAKG